MKNSSPQGPIRIQKAIAQAGIASRRAAEKLIIAGEVMLNGKVVTEMGQKMIMGKVESENVPLSLLESEISEELKDYQNHFHPQNS